MTKITLSLDEDSVRVLLELVNNALDNHRARYKILRELQESLSAHYTPHVTQTRYCTDITGFMFVLPIDYSSLEPKRFKRLTFYEDHEKDIAVLKYADCTYFVRISAVKNLPYPVPIGYFRHHPISSIRITAIRTYRQYLAEQQQKQEKEKEQQEKQQQGKQEERKQKQKQPLIDSEDAYRPIVNVDTRVPKEDYTKIESISYD